MSSQWQSLPTFVVSAVVASLLAMTIKFIQHRRFYKDLPKPPHHFLWGHLKLIGEIKALLPDRIPFQIIVTTLAAKYNLPRVFYLDLWPIGPCQLIITDPDLAFYITATKNYPKHLIESLQVDPIIGKGNILTANGQVWKNLHQIVSTAFAPSRIRGMLVSIAEEAIAFRSILNKLAESGEIFSMEEVITHLMFNVICKATFGFSLDSQNKEASVIELFHTILYSHTIERDSWNPVKRFNARQKRLTAIHQLNQSLSKIIRERFEVLHRDNLNINNKGTLNIMDMVLRGRIEETRKSGADPSKALNKDFMHAAITTAKSYLLGGIGTTSDTLSFTFMLLSTDSKAVHCLREEHDRVFTAGIDATFKMLQEDSQKISELKYTNNVLKEALRLYPVGGTVRAADPTGFFIYNGRQYPTKSQMIWPVQHTMHYNSEFFPNPGKFDPDRFVRDELLHKAWRPFECGPRACPGQAFAMEEMKVILLFTIRDFDFQCANLKPNKTPRVPWTDLDLTFGDLAFQDCVLEARPRDGMPFIVKRRN